MSREHKIVAATLPCPGDGKHEAKIRYVIAAWFYPGSENAFEPAWNLIKEYSTHMEILPGQKGFTEGLHDGHYYRDWANAFSDFAERVTQHNKAFREGNVSHIPGIDYVDCGCDYNPDPLFTRGPSKDDEWYDKNRKGAVEWVAGMLEACDNYSKKEAMREAARRIANMEAESFGCRTRHTSKIIDADKDYPIQERAEGQRRKLSKDGKGKYIEGS